MNRRAFVTGLGAVLAAPLVTAAQPGKAPRIALLGLGSAEASPFFEALRQGLRDRGWVEGQNIVFEDRSNSSEGVSDATRNSPHP